jgi:hypothetical protein
MLGFDTSYESYDMIGMNEVEQIRSPIEEMCDMITQMASRFLEK